MTRTPKTYSTFTTGIFAVMLWLLSALLTAAGIPLDAESPPQANAQATPEAALKLVFAAARSGELEKLKALLPPKTETDGDVIELCMIANGSDEKRAEFRSYFATGKLKGTARIEGAEAEVDFTFGPKGSSRDETMHMVRVGDRWYLQSF